MEKNKAVEKEIGTWGVWGSVTEGFTEKIIFE